MKKIYATLLAGLACMASLDASAFQVTLEFDSSALEITLRDYDSSIEYTDGGAVVTYPENTAADIAINCKEGYVITQAQEKGPSDGDWNDLYCYDPTSYSIWASSYQDGYSYKISTGKLEELRTAQVTLKVDNPSAIQLRTNWTYETITPTETETVIKYVPGEGKEAPFTITSVNGNDFYKVMLNDQEVTGSYGSYYLDGMADGDVIDVKVNYPDEKRNLVFNLSDECKEGLITSVTVNEIPLENWQNAEVQLGSKVVVTFSEIDFNITKFDCNGESIGWYGDFYSPYEFTMKSDAIFDVEATPYAKIPMTIKVEKASYIIAYTGWDSTENNIQLNDGETQIEISESQTEFRIKATELANITNVVQDGMVISPQSDRTYVIPVTANSVIEIETEEIIRDKSFIFYFDSPEKALNYDENLWGYSMSAAEGYRQVALEKGYNEVKFGTEADGQFYFGVGGGTHTNVFLYVNGVTPTYEYETVEYFFTPEEGDVLKCYIGAEPANYTLSFDVEEGLTPEVTVDKVTPLYTLDDTTVFQGTCVSIKPADDKTFTVTANDTPVTAEDGVFNLTVNDNTTVKIASDTSSVTEIESENAHAEVYNLQGIRVNSDKLPAGIYIINGKKTVIR